MQIDLGFIPKDVVSYLYPCLQINFHNFVIQLINLCTHCRSYETSSFAKKRIQLLISCDRCLFLKCILSHYWKNYTKSVCYFNCGYNTAPPPPSCKKQYAFGDRVKIGLDRMKKLQVIAKVDIPKHSVKSTAVMENPWGFRRERFERGHSSSH